MKRSLIISLLLLTVCQLFAQSQILYKGGDTIRGKNVTYICKSWGGDVNVYNTLNRDTSDNMYYDNGKLVETLEEIDAIDATYKYDIDDLYRIAKVIFSSSELKILKDNKVVLFFDYLTNKEGVAIEINFTFRKKSPVLSTLDPDRLYELEKKLKVEIKVDIVESSRNIKNPKWMDSFDFKEMK